MKEKPHKHRTQNTFRFQSFQKKIKKVKVSSRSFILQKLRNEADSQTEFSKTLQKWQELNLTKGFKDFRKDVGDDIHSLSQLLLNEKRIVAALESHLNVADNLSLNPLLHALVAFATDLPESFFKNYLYSFLTLLKNHLASRCNESIENIFVCYVSLFTLGQKYIKAEIVKFYHEEDFAQLLSKSYPWYINECAAQSLGFIIRKLPNQKYFFSVAFGKLKKDETQKEGLGRLIFHVLKSDVTRRLHSSSASALSTVFDVIREPNIPLQPSLEAIEYAFHKLTEHVTSKSDVEEEWITSWREDSHLIWPTLWQKVSWAIENLKNADSEIYLNAILQAIYKIIQYKHGILVLDAEFVIGQLIEVVNKASSDDTFQHVNSILMKLMLSSHHNLSHDILRKVLEIVISLRVPSHIVFSFIEQLEDYPQFDEEVLSVFLKYINSLLMENGNLDIQKEVLSSLVNLISSRQSPIMAGGDLESWKRFPLDFSLLRSSSVPISTLIESLLSEGLKGDCSSCEKMILACICIPHIFPLRYEDFVPSLFYILSDALEFLSKKGDDNEDISVNHKMVLSILGYVIEAIHHVIPDDDFVSSFSDIDLFSLLLNSDYKENVYLLKAIHIYVQVISKNYSSDIEDFITLKRAYELLSFSLSSPKPLVRLLVSKILFQLNFENSDNVFALMVEAESVPITPWEYKDRLRILNKLDYDHLSQKKLDYEEAPLLFLIGQLHINFKEIWPPVRKHIASFALGMAEDTFWLLWLPCLKEAAKSSLKELCGGSHDADMLEFEDPILAALHSNSSLHPGFANLIAKPSLLHFRDQLWQSMSLFPDICERRNREVMSLFFDFLYQEYFPADVNVAPTQDISKHLDIEGVEDEKETAEDFESTYLDDVDVEKEESLNEEADPRIRKAPTGTLCNHISLFAKFRNPKALYRSRDLLEIYKEFLSHPYLPAQKLALDAILAYNFKYLTPYKESLYKILDDKTFKDELALFSIDGTSDDEARSLKDEHRKDFMPILMKILYGKMLYKTGSNSSGKGKSSFRKAIVIRFLAGASESEMNTFLNLTFDVFLSHLDGTSLDVVKRVMSSISPKEVVPLKRIHGAYRTLETIIDKLGNLVHNKRGFFLKVLLFILSTTSTLLEMREKISHHYYSLLKNLRQMSLQKIISFFQVYRDYPWDSDELEALFLTGVWPTLPRLQNEGIYNPTTLMKLFLCWADNPRYHTLLARYNCDDPTLTPLPYVMKLMHHPKCSLKVIDASLTLVERLLNKQQDLEINKTLETVPLTQEFQLDVETHGKEKGLSDLSFGEYLVAMYLDEILQVMRRKLCGESVSKRDLGILIHIASWIKCEDIGEEFLSLIVPLLSKNSIKDDEKVCFLLDVCSNLLLTVHSPERYLTAFLHMFSVFNGRHQRGSLSSAINAIAQRTPSYSQLSEWSTNLNSWNPKLADEIDFEVRLSCFKEINEYLENCSELQEEVCILLINNNIWSLKHIEDTAIRDSSLLNLQNLIKAISRLQPTFGSLAKTVLEQHFLPLIRAGLKHAKEKVRDDMMILLHTASINCHNFVQKLEDLFKLADLNEAENDFFLNMCHIQRHRRARALNKLCEKLNSGSISLQKDTIVEFLLPLASSFLFKDDYAKDDYLISSAVSSMGCLARQLNWFHYQNLLRFYLNIMSRELKYLRLGVRVLEAVIDAFHEKLVFSDACEKQNNSLMGDFIDQGNLSINSNAQSKKVYKTLTTVFIPQIQHALASRSLRDTEHKVNKKRYPEEDDIRRIPLALALIKLLKKLPQQALDSNVNSVLMKLINFLKSRSESIRQEARNMLVKVMVELGGKYFSNLVIDMNTLLTRGFHSHVLVYTLHTVLSELQTDLLPEHVDNCLEEIMELCIEDLFGEQAKEKEVAQIISKLKEAKAERGLAIIGIASQVISTDHLETLILPLKKTLETFDKKKVNKVATCLQKVASGLERNPNITLDQKAIFLYGILNEKIKEISLKEESKAQEKKERPYQIRDSFLLLPEPRKVNLKPKTSPKDTSYVLVEFSLRLLYTLLRHGYFEASNSDHCGYLDPFVTIVKKCLSADYPEINVYAVHILSWLLKYPLPSLKEQIQNIVGLMFVLLNKYSSTNLLKGKIYELVQLVFKTLSLILKDHHDISFEEDHLNVLIHYAQDNLKDYDQHHSTFTILQALIHRKIHTEEFHKVMVSVKEMSISSSNVNMLDQARCCYFKYIMNYPKHKKQHISTFLYYLTHLSYSIPEGQLSAILMVNDILSKYPPHLFTLEVEKVACFKITQQLIAQDSKECKKLLQKALKTLYLKSERKEVLINLCLGLLDSNKHKNRSEEAACIHMGAQAFLAFLDAPQNAHPTLMFPSVAPKIVSLLQPGRFEVYSADDDELVEENQLAILDSSLNSLLELLSKLMDLYMTQSSMSLWNEHIEAVVWVHVKQHLLYPNLQSRLLASTLIGAHFSHYPLEKDPLSPLTSTPEATKSLILDLCDQLATESEFQKPLLDQLSLAVVRNLVYLVRLSQKMPIRPSSRINNERESDTEENCTEGGEEPLDMDKNDDERLCEGALWVLQRVSKLSYKELRLNAKTSTLCREAFLNLIAGIVVVLREKFARNSALVSFVLDHVVRELSDEHLPETLSTKTKELASLIKENLGIERYSEESVKSQLKLSKRKLERKARDRERVITNPQLAMKKRSKKHAAKKESKKRKLAELKLKPNKKRRLRDMAVVVG